MSHPSTFRQVLPVYLKGVAFYGGVFALGGFVVGDRPLAEGLAEAAAFGLLVGLTAVARWRYPVSQLRLAGWGCALALALGAAGQMLDGARFPVGMALGAAVGWVLGVWLYARWSGEREIQRLYLEANAAESGYGPLGESREPAGVKWAARAFAVGALLTTLLFGLPALRGAIEAGAGVGVLGAAEAETDALDPDWHWDAVTAAWLQGEDARDAFPIARRVPESMPEPRDRTGDKPPRPNERPTAAVLRALRDDLATRGEALALARTLAGKDRGRSGVVWAEVHLNTLLPHLEAARDAGRLLSDALTVDLEDGRPADALGCVEGTLSLAAACRDEPHLIGVLVAGALDRIAVSGCERLLGQGEPPAEGLARLQAALLRESRRALPAGREALRTERAAWDRTFRAMESGRVSVRAFLTSLSGPGIDASANAYATALRHDHADCLRQWNRVIVAAGLPAGQREAAIASWGAEMRAARATARRDRRVFTVTLFPAFPKTLSSADLSARQLRVAVLLIAFERHRQRVGEWPRAVGDVLPADVPTDATAADFAGFTLSLADGRLTVSAPDEPAASATAFPPDQRRRASEP